MQFSRVTRAVLMALYGGVAFSSPSDATANSLNVNSGSANGQASEPGRANPQPFLVIDRQAIERTGHVSVGRLLAELPMMGSALGPLFNNGGNGAAYVSLRHIGSEGSLILINGRRIAPDGNGSVDLNNIPLSAIERIEVLPLGSAAMFGSDAALGAINLVTRGDFAGAQANLQIGKFDAGDGQHQAYDFSVGSRDARATIFFNASYVKQNPVSAGDRLISAEPLFGTGNAFGSSATLFGRLVDPNYGVTVDPLLVDLTCPLPASRCQNPANFRPWNGSTDGFNYAPANFLLTGEERAAIFSQGRYAVNEHFTIHYDARYSQRASTQQWAPTPLLLGTLGGGREIARTTRISAMNPFNPFGVDIGTDSFLIARRTVELGPRIFKQDVDNLRLQIGVEGQISLRNTPWGWGFYLVDDEIHNNQTALGSVNLGRVRQALGPSADCTNECTPLNLFGEGSITPAMADYISATAQDQTKTQLRGYSLTAVGQPIGLPAGQTDIQVGLNSYSLAAQEYQDGLVASGLSSLAPRQIVNGEYSSDAVFLNAAVPILGTTRSDGYSVSAQAGARRTEYEAFGSANDFDLSLNYQPFAGLNLSAGYSRGHSTPSLTEAFLSRRVNYQNFLDPCSDMYGTIDGSARPNVDPATGEPLGPEDPLSPQSIDNCIAQGVDPRGFYNQNAGPPPPQSRGGNASLNAEESGTYYVTLTYQPEIAAGTELALSAYKTSLTGVISTMGPTSLLYVCTGGHAPELCGRIVRDPSGSLRSLDLSFANFGLFDVMGVDFAIQTSGVHTALGIFDAALGVSYVGDYSRQYPTPFSTLGIEPDDHIGVGQNIGDFAVPRWKGQMDIVWENGPWEAQYSINYIHHQFEGCVNRTFQGGRIFCSDPMDPPAPFGTPLRHGTNHIGSVSYHDIQVSYQVGAHDLRLSAGINNLWDKGPPLSSTAFANSFDASLYRVPGRFGYVRLTMDF